MNKELIWESVKTPLRQGLLFVYALLVNKFFELVANLLGFSFTEEQKLQIIGFGTPLVWSILSFIDKFMHEKGKEEDNPQLIKGISRF